MAHFSQWWTLGFPYSFKGLCASKNLCQIRILMTQLFASGEIQCFEESFTRSLPCIMGLLEIVNIDKCLLLIGQKPNMSTSVNKELSKYAKTIPFTICSILNQSASNLESEQFIQRSFIDQES